MDFRYGHHTDSFAEHENDDVEEDVDNIKLCDDEVEEEAVVFDSAPYNRTPARIVAAININVTTINTSLGIPVEYQRLEKVHSINIGTTSTMTGAYFKACTEFLIFFFTVSPPPPPPSI